MDKSEWLIDIGINLMHRQYERDRAQVIERADAANVSRLIITGTSVRESKRAAEYAKTMPGKLYCTAGVHPHDAKTCDEKTIAELKKLLSLPQTVAVGECGLDYDRDFSPRDIQRKWFEEQIHLAITTQKPLFLHERAAYKDFKAILKAYPEVCNKAVVHCFTGAGAELRGYLDMGCSIGITGWICDNRRGMQLRDLIKLIPLDRLMIETDGPFLLPGDLVNKPKDRRNEPAFLPHILHAISKYIGKEETELAKIIHDNTIRFFGLSS